MSELNLFQRLLQVMNTVKAVPKTGKAADNIGGFAFHKVDDVVDALRPACIANGVFVASSIAKRDNIPEVQTSIREIEKTSRGGSYIQVERRTEVLLDVTFVNADNPTDILTIQSFGEGLDYGDKATGKAAAYALKTALLANFQMRGQPDNEADQETQQPVQSAKPVTQKPKQPPSKPQAKPQAKEWPPDVNKIELPGPWQNIVIQTTAGPAARIRGRKLGELQPNQLEWMQDKWVYPGSAPTKADMLLKRALQVSKMNAYSEPTSTPTPNPPPDINQIETPF